MLLLDTLKKGKLALVQRLIEKGDNDEINYQDIDGLSPLHYCVLQKWHHLAEQLLMKGADIQATTKLNGHAHMTALHIAAMIGDSHLVSLLLLWGAEVDAEEDHFETPAQIATRYHHLDIANLLNHRKNPQHHEALVTFMNPMTKEFCVISKVDILAKRLLELHNSSPKMAETREWLNRHYPQKSNIVNFLQYKFKRKKTPV